MDWECENHVVVERVFFPDPNMANRDLDKKWEIDYDIGLEPFDGDTFVILKSGALNPQNNELSKASQTVEFFAGQKNMNEDILMTLM